MICPARYAKMATAEAPAMPDADTPDACDMSDASLLEAALDTCMMMAAAGAASEAARVRAMDTASPAPPPPRSPGYTTCVFSVRLAWLRERLGGDYTKRGVATLFNAVVARRYLDSGWVGVAVNCGASSSPMAFRFGPAPKARPEPRRVLDVRERGTAALAELGEILGVRRTDRRDQESTVEYLEDLRMAVRLMRFDLEACRRETEQARGTIDFINNQGGDPEEGDDPDDTGHYPPFEGDPDDENFST